VRQAERDVDRVDLDHLDWVEEDGGRRRSGSAGRRKGERRSSAGRAPARERRGGAERREAERRQTGKRAATGSQAARTNDARTKAPRATAGRGRPRATPRAAAAGPGVAERRALMLVTGLLLLYGLVMAYSASAAEGYFEHGSSFYFLRRQAVYAVAGLAAMWALSRVDYGRYKRLAVPVAGLVLGALVLVLIPDVGTSINGARRWLIVGGQSIMPSEFAKVAAVLLVATLVARRPAEVTTGRGFARLAAIGILPAAALIMLQPDLGTTLVLVCAVMAVLVVAGARLVHLALALAGGCLAVLTLIVVEPYRLERLTTFLDPWKDPQGSGFQATQSLISIASGRVFGVGLGNSVQKFGYLPEQTTDMITGIIGEELGLIGLCVLLALYAALAWACFRIALSCKDLFGKLLATGITAMIVGQACINIGAALGLLPLTGVPLPLVSCGGTSMLIVLSGLGIMHNIATNRRSFIVASAQRADRPARRGGDRGAPAARPGRRR
jgi:cell division protein FtsW